MQVADFGIEASYAISNNYRVVSENSRKRNILHDHYLEIFEKIFTIYHQFADQTQQLCKIKHQKSFYIEQFKNFLRKFTEIIKNTSEYHISCIIQSKQNRQDIITRPTQQITSRAQKCSKSQNNFISKHDEVVALKQQANKMYYSLKNQASQPSVFYNAKHMKNKIKLISQKLNEINKIENQMKGLKQEINNNAEQYQGFLINFRKKLLQNKYNMLNRMADQSKNFRNYLTQILLLLIQCVNSKMEIFIGLVKNPKEDTITISQSKGRKKGQDQQGKKKIQNFQLKKKAEDLQASVTNLSNSIQQYNHVIDQIIWILKGLDKAFKNLNIKMSQIIQNNKKFLVDSLNNIYTIDESPSRQVNDTLDLYEYYTAKMSGISDKIYQGVNKLVMLKQNVKRYSDVTLSLIKSNQKGKEDIKQQLQFDQVYNQISYDFVTEILVQIYKAYKQTLGGLKTYFNEKYYKTKKIKVQDSMQISHVDETIIQTKKRPCKKQLWLWRDWRDKNNFTITPSQVNVKEIDQYLSSIKFEEESKQLKSFQCSLTGKNLKGILKICEKTIQFTSFIGTSNIHLNICYPEITSVETRVKGSQRQVKIQTEKGELIFSKFLDAQQTQSLIKQTLEKANKDRGKMLKKRAVVQLTPQQIDHLLKNRAKINQQRPNSEGMTKIRTIFIDNIGIDQVYEYIYSDKQFTLRGKPQDSFFAFTQKKAKNFNYVTSAYDRPGPQFYSGNPQSKFTNCPIYSTRIVDFDHPMPYIPLMPKSCHCHETCNLYWLSNESFDYFVISQSSQAPYADTFICKILHRVYKQGTGVKLQVSGGLFFVKQTAMKGMLKSKGENQMMQLAGFTISQIQKTLNIIAGNQTAKDIQPVQQKTQAQKAKDTQKPNTQISKLQNQKKLLIIALVAVFLINIILKFFIS